ncbi:MAG: SDR family oxidoreductase [Sphingobacteriales bacterium]|nr:MAG: SDR family oxidoreductase [Sphingobacteriales bacterium]
MAIQKQYTLITGGSGGIGYELAKLFAADKHNLVLVSRHQAALDRVAAELRQQHDIDVITLATDLFNVDNAYALHKDLQSRNVKVNILVNNAGQGLYGEFSETELQRELDIIQLNISSLIVLTKLFLQDMLQQGQGKILNLSSIASRLPGPWQSVYHGTKAFVQSFTEAIREEVKDKNIVVTALLPGATQTDFFRKAGMLQSKTVQEGKLAPADEVAKAGYDALMKGDDKVVAGALNKIQTAIAAITPDDKLAAKVYDQQAPVGHDDKK